MARRRRRPAAETREEILQAAKSQIAAQGPSELTLDDVAREVGISRQAVLHHFGSRDGLLRAVVERAWLGLFADLRTLANSAQGVSPEGFMDLLDDVTRRKGNARLGGWLLLSENGLPTETFVGALSDLPARMQGGDGADRIEDTRFGLLLVASALFGDAIFGERLRQALGMPDGEAHRAVFRRWIANRLWSDGDASGPASGEEP